MHEIIRTDLACIDPQQVKRRDMSCCFAGKLVEIGNSLAGLEEACPVRSFPARSTSAPAVGAGLARKVNEGSGRFGLPAAAMTWAGGKGYEPG